MRENDKLQSDSSFHSRLISSLSHSLSLSLSIIIACQYVFFIVLSHLSSKGFPVL